MKLPHFIFILCFLFKKSATIYFFLYLLTFFSFTEAALLTKHKVEDLFYKTIEYLYHLILN